MCAPVSYDLSHYMALLRRCWPPPFCFWNCRPISSVVLANVLDILILEEVVVGHVLQGEGRTVVVDLDHLVWPLPFAPQLGRPLGSWLLVELHQVPNFE